MAATAVETSVPQLARQVTSVREALDRRRLDGERLEDRPAVRSVERGGVRHRSSSGDHDADASTGEDRSGRLVEFGVGDDDVDLVETTGVGE